MPNYRFSAPFHAKIADPSLDQANQEQYSSSYSNSIRSTNIDEQPLNEQHDDNPDPPSNSDNEEDCDRLLIASSASMSQCNSPVVSQNEATLSPSVEQSSNNIYSKQSTINHCKKSSSVKSCQSKQNAFAEAEEHHPNIMGKRKQSHPPSSSITTTKHSTRLASKRARID